eukprot:TRINITY_DN13243_c0_g1_i4.p1 TRINITY_DN13243_c0_g1~~TRINITY_DN13243_c0_g1_i4.p1  ORF type:complete len:431 (-),score=61.57 TRINITY_DN13243_c0_g1_i4:511-1803(-)
MWQCKVRGEFDRTLARCCFFFPTLWYMDSKKVLASSVLFGVVQSGVQEDPAPFVTEMWVGTFAAVISWCLGWHLRIQAELVLMNQQLRSGRKSLGAFLTAAFDVYFRVDSRLRILGPVPELTDFLKMQLSAANSTGNMDGAPLLDIVSRDDRENLRSFLSRTAEGASIAATTNMNIMFGDDTMARSQLFHCVDDDLFDGLTHWVGLRQLGDAPCRVQPNVATGQLSCLVPKPPLHPQQLDDTLSFSVSQTPPWPPSSSSSSASSSRSSFSVPCKKPASVTLRFDSTQEALNVLSFQVDLSPAGAAGPTSLTQTIKEGMHPHDWRVMQGWLEDTRSRLVAGSSPKMLPDVLMQLRGFDVVLMAAQASLDLDEESGKVFAMKLESPNILPMSELRAAALKDAKPRYVAPPQVLGRVEEVSSLQEEVEKTLAL